MGAFSRISLHSAHLDDLDLALIVLLQQDGRTSLTELGKKLGVSHGTVRNRLERLLNGPVIRIAATVDPTKVGFPIQVLIGLNADLLHVTEIEEQLAKFNEVTFVTTVTGRLDFFIGAAFVSNAHLREFLVEKLSRVKGIRSSETFHSLNQVKRVWQWAIPGPSERKRLNLSRQRVGDNEWSSFVPPDRRRSRRA